MKLGRKVGNRSLIRSENFFFRDHHDSGKKGNTRSKPYFFWEHQVLEILASGPTTDDT